MLMLFKSFNDSSALMHYISKCTKYKKYRGFEMEMIFSFFLHVHTREGREGIRTNNIYFMRRVSHPIDLSLKINGDDSFLSVFGTFAFFIQR
jgi:hypothetical protein